MNSGAPSPGGTCTGARPHDAGRTSRLCSGIIWGLAVEGSMSGESMQLADTDTWIASFGEDEAGELYLADMGGGMVYRVVAR